MAATQQDACFMDRDFALTPHLLLEMAKHLSRRTLLKCRLVCKQWCEVFSLAVHSVSLHPQQKLQHTLRHLRHTFTKVQTIRFDRELCNDTWTEEAIQALGSMLGEQRSIKHIVIGNDFYFSRRPTAAFTQALPLHLESLDLGGYSCSSHDCQALAALTNLTSLSVSCNHTKSYRSADQNKSAVLLAIAGMPHLRKLEMQVYTELYFDMHAHAALLVKVAAECLQAVASLVNLTLECQLQRIDQDAEVVDSLIDVVQQHAGPDFQHLALGLPSAVQLLVTAQMATVRCAGTSIYTNLQQEQTTINPADHQHRYAHVAAVQPEHVSLTYAALPEISTANIDVDLQHVPGVTTLTIYQDDPRTIDDDDNDYDDEDYDEEVDDADSDADTSATGRQQCASAIDADTQATGQRCTLTLANASKLRKLTVQNQSGHAAAFVASTLPAQCPSLCSLTLYHVTMQLQPVSMLTSLTKLSICSPSKAASPRPLPVHPVWLPTSLKQLVLDACDILSCSECQWPQLTNLEGLFLGNCWVHGSTPLQAFSAASCSLQELHLLLLHSTECDLESFLITAAHTFPQLEHMVAAGLAGDNSAMPGEILLRCMPALTQLKQLHTLHMPLATFNLDAVQYLASMTQLETLYVDRSILLVDGYLQQLSRMPSLQRISIRLGPKSVGRQVTTRQLQKMLAEACAGNHVVPCVDMD